MEFHQFTWINHWDKLKSWLDFGDFDFIFKAIDLIFKVIVLYVEHVVNQWMDFLRTCIDISLWQA